MSASGKWNGDHFTARMLFLYGIPGLPKNSEVILTLSDDALEIRTASGGEPVYFNYLRFTSIERIRESPWPQKGNQEKATAAFSGIEISPDRPVFYLVINYRSESGIQTAVFKDDAQIKEISRFAMVLLAKANTALRHKARA